MNQSVNNKTIVFISATTYFICIVFFSLYHYETIYKDFKHISVNNIALISFGSIIGLFIGTVIFMHLLEKHNSSIITTITYTTPVFVLLIALLLLKEKINIIKITGIITTVIGVIMICYL